MTIKDIIWLLAHSEDAHDKREWAVLYFRAQGKNPQQVADQLHMSVEWVALYMGKVIKRFGIPVRLDKYKKLKTLQDTVFPAVREFIEGNRDTLKELPPPPVGEPPLEPADMELVKDYPKAVRPVVTPVVTPKPIVLVPRPGPNYWWIAYVVATIGVIWVVWHFAFEAGRQSTPTTPPFSTSIPAITPVATVAVPPTVSSPIPSALPTDTLVPTATETHIPTPTPKGYYNEEEKAVIRPGIYASLGQNFMNEGFVGCSHPVPGFGVSIWINNDSDAQFAIRYDSASFHAQDDLGNTYPLKYAGLYWCNAGPGPQEELLRPSASTNFSLAFSGQVPLEAKYLIITVDSISGSGALIFHKNY